MEIKIENLLSRVVALEECFDSPPSGVAQQRCRNDLIRYATISPLFPALIPLSQLNSIEEQLRSLSEKQESLLPTGHADYVQVCGDVFLLLEDLREAILSYQVRARPQA